MSENHAEIKKVLDSSVGAPLKDYLLDRLNELRDIDNIIEKGTPTHQSIEIKAQKRAYSKLKEIMAVIITFSEEAKSDDPRDSFRID